MLLQFNHVKKSYPAEGWGKCGNIVLHDLMLQLESGDSLALIGESGCGKSTLGRLAAGLDLVDSGEILWNGENFSGLSSRRRKELRRHVQMVYQNSTSTFHPLRSIGESIREPLLNYRVCGKQEAKEKAIQCMEQVGLGPELYSRMPRELSGGQRQRANIARGLILYPKLLICDEVVSSLDFSLRRQILDLLNDLKEKFSLSYLFISHDLSTVKYVCNRVAVLYQGEFVERLDSVENLQHRVRHPYSRDLFQAVPIADPTKRKKRTVVLTKGWDIRPESGCRFQNRCRFRTELCENTRPQERKIAPGHWVSCHYDSFEEK